MPTQTKNKTTSVKAETKTPNAPVSDSSREKLAEDFAVCFMANTQIERLMGNPFNNRHDGIAMGTWLARNCHKLAGDFLNELDRLSQTH